MFGTDTSVCCPHTTYRGDRIWFVPNGTFTGVADFLPYFIESRCLCLRLRRIFGWRMITRLFHWWDRSDRRKLKKTQKNLSHCHLVYHKYKSDCFAFDFKFWQKEGSSVYVPLCLMQSHTRHLTHSHRWSNFVKYSPLWSLYTNCLSEMCDIVLFPAAFSDRQSLCLWALLRIAFSYRENRFRET